MNDGELIFVYNVDATPTALLRDLYLSVTTGSTDCHLCDLTFGKVLKDPQWAAFIRALPLPATFHLRSTVVARYPETKADAFPAAYLKEGSKPLRQVISADEMNAAQTLDDLRRLVTRCVDQLIAGDRAAAVEPVSSG